MKLTVGRIVHYADASGACFAAICVAGEDTTGAADLQVFLGNGTALVHGVRCGAAPATWHDPRECHR